MADCCTEIRGELAALRAEIAKLKPIDEGAILAKAESKARNLIEQLTPGIATAVAIGLIKPVRSLAESADGKAESALAKAGEALSKIAGLLATLASILLTIGALQALGSRIDALEREVNSLGGDLSKLFGIVNGVRQIALDALGKANSAIGMAQQAFQQIQSLQQIVNFILQRVNSLEQLVKSLQASISNIESKLRDIFAQLAQILFRLSAVEIRSEEAVSIANSALQKTREIQRIAEKAAIDAGLALTGVRGLQTLVPQIEKKAEEALDEARKANRRALIPGQKGDKGDKGDRGIPGLPGKPGDKGDKGDRGIPGLPGKPGDKGDKGDKGEPGKPGTNGKPGTKGDKGDKGDRGLRGLPGRDGIDGKPGAPGRPGRDGINGKDVNPNDIKRFDDKLNKILRGVALIPNNKPLSYSETVNAAATGVCRTTQPGGCTRRLADNTKDNILKEFKKELDDLLKNIEKFGIAGLALQLAKIDRKLGIPLKNGISGGIMALVNNQITQSIVNWMTLATTIHNALMLSNNLVQTLFGTIETILSVVGIKLKNEKNEDASISAMFDGMIKGMLIKLLGEVEYKVISEQWNKSVRIYQAAANVMNTVQSIGSSTLSALEVIGSWNAKVANALKKWGVVSDKAYEWFNPSPNFQNRFFTSLEKAENVVSQVNAVSSEVLSVKENVTQLFTLKDDLNKSLQDENLQKPDAPTIESLRQKYKDQQEKTASQAKDLESVDKVDAND